MGNAEGRAPRRAEPRGNPGSFDELHRLCKGDTHGAHEHPGPLRLPLQRHLRGGPPAGTHRGVPHAARGHGQLWQPQCPGPAPAGRPPASQGRVPDAPGQVCDVAVRRRVPGGRLHGHADPGQPRPAGRLRDRGGTLPAECHRPAGAGGGARVPPAARGGGSHPHPGWEVLGPELGDNAQRGLRGGPRQLLPPGQRAGAGGCGAGGQHAAPGEHLRLWLPAHPARGQRRLQRAPGQQLERGGGPGEEAAPPARDAGPGSLPEPLEEPLPLRLQRHRGLTGTGTGTGDRGQHSGDCRDSRDSTAGTAQWGLQGQHSGDGTAGMGGQHSGDSRDRGDSTAGMGQQGWDSRDSTAGTAGTAGTGGQHSGDSTVGMGQQGLQGQGDSTVGMGQQGLQGQGDSTVGTAGTGGTAQRGQHSKNRTAGTVGQQGQQGGDRGTAGTGQQG